MLKQATEDIDNDDTVYISYCLDGSLFGASRLLLHNLLFADDADLVAHTESTLKLLTFCFSEAVQHLGLGVSLKKTEVLRQPALQEDYNLHHMTIGDNEPKAVHQLT